MLDSAIYGAANSGIVLNPYHEWDLSTLFDGGDGNHYVTDLTGRADLVATNAQTPTLQNTNELVFTNDCLKLPSLNTGAGIITLVFEWLSSTSGTTVLAELSSQWNANTGATFAIFNNLNNVAGQLGMSMRGDGSTNQRIESKASYIMGSFKRVAIEFDFSVANGEIKLFDSGGLQTTAVISSQSFNAGTQQTDYALHFGARNCASVFMNGTMKDKIYLFDRELTSDERAALL